MKLIKYNDNYADEFDVEGFLILTDEEWENQLHISKLVFDTLGSVEIYFGTNEFIEYDSFDEWLNTFKVKDISDELAKEIIEIFGLIKVSWRPGYKFGTILLPNDTYLDEQPLA